MKSKITLIIKHFKPKFCKSCDSKSLNRVDSSFNWETSLIKRMSPHGWIPNKPNSKIDCIIKISKNNFINCEIRTVTKNGVYFAEAHVSGSKANKKEKEKSLQRKLQLLGSNGIYSLIDIRKADKCGAMVYVISTEDFIKYFGNKKVTVSPTELDRFIENRMVDVSIKYK